MLNPPPWMSPALQTLPFAGLVVSLQLDERDQDLTAARSTNRELMAQMNTTGRR
ncbi:MAG: hypothetical protein ACRDNS_25440 [Trebonia sp.]